MDASINSLKQSTLERTALVAETSLSFHDVRQKSSVIACALRAAGLQSGDYVAIATENRAGFFCGFAGCFDYGCPVIVIDPFAAPQEISLMLNRAAPEALIADEKILRILSGLADFEFPNVVLKFGTDDKHRITPGRRRSWRTLFSSAPRWPCLDDFQPDESIKSSREIDHDLPAYVMFTSGSTGKPKGVVVSRSALQNHIQTLSRVFGYNDKSTLLCHFPTHHTDGLVHSVAAPLLTGMSVVHPGPFNSPVDLPQLLRGHKISHFLVVPTMLAMIKRMFADRSDLFVHKDFRFLISTAGNLDLQLWREIQELFGIQVSNFYGMTETVSGSLFCGPSPETYRIGTLGKPIDARVRIVDEGGVKVSAGNVGELQISGGHLMTEYLGDVASTKSVIKDGWLSTGDLFAQDCDGFFHFKGRRKNIIKRGGITVYPVDIQRIVSSMKGVLEVEVIGLPHAMFEESITVCAIVKAGVTADDIRKTCRACLSPERWPDRVELMDRLPRGPSGKVQRDLLIAAIRESKTVDSEFQLSIRDKVIKLASETFAIDASELDEYSSPENVENWDSYALMEFVIALENAFAIRMKPRYVMRLSDIGQAIQIISSELKSAEKNS